MNRFAEMLEKEYQDHIEFGIFDGSRLEYLGGYVFNYTTYRSDLDEEFAKRTLKIIEVIHKRQNFEFISTEENHVEYITIVNMPFFRDKLEWGGSIRGAWFDEYNVYKMDCERIVVEEGEIHEFIQGLLDWIETFNNQIDK